MNSTLVRAVIVLIPVAALFLWSLMALLRTRGTALLVQSAGAFCLLTVVVIHVFEARHLFRFMGWGEPHSAGHYVDLSAAFLGLVLLSVACMLHVGRPRRSGRV